MELEDKFEKIRQVVQIDIDKKNKGLIISKYLPLIEETTNNLKKYLKEYDIVGITLFGGAPTVDEAVLFDDGRSKYNGITFNSIIDLVDYCHNKTNENKEETEEYFSFQNQLEWVLEAMDDSVEKFKKIKRKI